MNRRWMIFCEAVADFRTAETLIDQILLLRCNPWVKDLYEQDPALVRCWHGRDGNNSWFDVHRVSRDATDLGIKLHYGHFDGRRGEPGALMLDTIFRVRRALLKQGRGTFTIDAIVVVWDMDRQGGRRRTGLSQVAGNNTLFSGATLVVGCPDPVRETWVVAGFVPQEDEERQRLRQARQELGFAPNEQPHLLSASDELAKRHAKRVLRELLGVATWEREERCLQIPDEAVRALLASRGAGCGLEGFLRAVETTLAPKVDPACQRVD